MSTELAILGKDKWFLRQESSDDKSGYPIYYRHAIAYSMAKCVLEKKEEGISQDKINSWIQNEINSLIDAFRHRRVYKGEMIEIFPLADKGEEGFVLVDQTDSWYPLVFYSQTRQNKKKGQDRHPRVQALGYSLGDIKKALDCVLEKLAKLTSIADWDQQFQGELFELYPNNPQ